jgi:histidinol-phosphate aminotransferase
MLEKVLANRAKSYGNFVFFNSGRPYQVIAAAPAAHGIDIGRAYPPFDT